MTDNMKFLINTITTVINTKYGDEIPSLNQIFEVADEMRPRFEGLYTVSDEEFLQIKRVLSENILHSIGDAMTLRGHDSTHQTWYFLQENDGFYWNRYKQYLKEVKHWSADVVNKLNETTDKTMDDLGNPKNSQKPFQRRGLLLGDVQSGKTATYTAVCNKAADAGYKVIIILAGMMENLRVQTQERLDTEFVGIESKYTLDKKADNEIKNTAIGVGKIPPYNQEKRIACFTSVATDFNKSTLRALGLSLRSFNGTALFVVKKNKSVLNNLYQWLMENNADYSNGLIDLPLLLIDDEADNASVNTNSEEKNPTAINHAIRQILNCFRQASYLGITATPFANIFIDPDQDGEDSRDLFPKDFLTVLPTPDRYIGATQLFGIGDADEWGTEDSLERAEGKYSNTIISIENIEQDAYFRFKHKKELDEELYDLPTSLREAIRFFVLSTAISDKRKDTSEHRSMLVNVSRFTRVQNRVADLIDILLNEYKSDVENYSQLPCDEAEKIANIALLKETWEKYELNIVAGIEWEEVLHIYLFKAIRRIEVRSVNQQHGASTLNYYAYKDIGMRVIAVGGNSLSRGLTLEGLCVSYFYRNTMMYDTLLQMGRWFGYRQNYDDLFKIWMAEDAINWYGYITDAVIELKAELKKMERQNQTPEEFGLKVRMAPGALLITAKNKMRSATNITMPITVSGRMLETARLMGDKNSIVSNANLCHKFVENISKDERVEAAKYDDYTKALIWKNVPQEHVVELVKSYITHPWNLNFQPVALADYIAGDNVTLELFDVAIPFDKNDSSENVEFITSAGKYEIIPKLRPLEWDENNKNMIRVYAKHNRIGSGGCTKIGLSKEKIKELRDEHGNGRDSTYLKTERNPLLLLHVLKNQLDAEPELVYALGIGFPYGGPERTANYMVNTRELKNWVDIQEEDDDDDIN